MSVSDAAGSGVSLGFISADVTEQPVHQDRNVPCWQGMVGEKRRKKTRKKEPLNNNIVTTATYSADTVSSKKRFSLRLLLSGFLALGASVGENLWYHTVLAGRISLPCTDADKYYENDSWKTFWWTTRTLLA